MKLVKNAFVLILVSIFLFSSGCATVAGLTTGGATTAVNGLVVTPLIVKDIVTDSYGAQMLSTGGKTFAIIAALPPLSFILGTINGTRKGMEIDEKLLSGRGSVSGRDFREMWFPLWPD